MRTSEFWALMEQEYGPGYAEVVAEVRPLTSLGSRTADQALAAGVSARTVWEAVCRDLEVPEHHHWLVDRRARD